MTKMTKKPVDPSDDTQPGVKHPSSPPPPPARDAERLYDAYRARKALGAAIPPPTYPQLDDLERAAWEAVAAVE